MYVVVIFALVLLLWAKWKYVTNKLYKPGCYGHYRTRDSRAMYDCENCELEYECELATKERWGGR